MLIIFKWWWEMDCLAVLLSQNPHAHRFALSNQMVRLHATALRRCLITAFSRPLLKTKKAPRLRCIVFKWWWEMDSNHRRQCQQIYSLPPLATRESHQNGAGKGGRTPLTSLEGWCTADMPYPHYRFKVFMHHFRKNGTDEGSRTLKPCGTRT